MKSSKRGIFVTRETLRPRADSWDGPHFRPFQCGADYIEVPRKPHALFLDANEVEGTWIYVLKGAFYYRIGTERQRVERGEALITRRPDPGWLIWPAESLPVHTLWINVVGTPAMAVFDYLHLKYGKIQQLPRSSPAITLGRRLIALALEEPHRSAHFWSEQTFRWLNAWWKCAQDQHPATQRIALITAKPTRINPGQPNTMKNLASAMGYSRAYLTRKLTDQWGRSPGRVLREVRLEEAARLLRTTTLSVRDVAEKVGYSTSAAFSRAFVVRFKQSPLPYRRANG